MADETADNKAKVAKIIDAYVAHIDAQQKLPPDPEDAKKRFLPFRVKEMNLRTIRKDLEVLLEGNEKIFLDQVAAEVRMHRKIDSVISAYDPMVHPQDLRFERPMNDAQYVVIRRAEQERENALGPLDKVLARDSEMRIKKNNDAVAAVQAADALKSVGKGLRQDVSSGAGIGGAVFKALNDMGTARLQISDENGAGAGIIAYNVARDALNFAGAEEFKAQVKAEAEAKAKKEAPPLPEAKDKEGVKGVQRGAFPVALDETVLASMDQFAQSVLPESGESPLTFSKMKIKTGRGAA